MFDVAAFLRDYARNYTDVDDLYNVAKDEGLVSDRKEFANIIMDSFTDKEVVKHIYTELPFKRHWTKLETPRGKRIGLIKWTDNPRFVGKEGTEDER